ncbi:MAG: hypothetical protein RDV48_18870 [Candidatus Eremiobacteraeota bacterium]|nr:hypothetical protein [Candidatus Eremiobacteraeota bacterium]
MERLCQKGFALVMVLIIIIILVLLGVAVAGLSTMQARYSLEYNKEGTTRQAALAGISEATYTLNKSPDWSNLSAIQGNIPDQAFTDDTPPGATSTFAYKRLYPENDCYYRVTLEFTSSNSICTVTSEGFFEKEGEEVWKSTVKATFKRSAAFHYAICQYDFDFPMPATDPGLLMTLAGTINIEGDVGTLLDEKATIMATSPAKPLTIYKKPGSQVTLAQGSLNTTLETKADLAMPSPPIASYPFEDPSANAAPGEILRIGSVQGTVELTTKYTYLTEVAPGTRININSATKPVYLIISEIASGNLANVTINGDGKADDLIIVREGSHKPLHIDGAALVKAHVQAHTITVAGNVEVHGSLNALQLGMYGDTKLYGSAVGLKLSIAGNAMIKAGSGGGTGAAGKPTVTSWEED